MAETDPVQIVVEILNQTKDELAQIRKDIEELGLRDINIDLDINDLMEFERIQAKIAALEAQSINIPVESHMLAEGISVPAGGLNFGRPNRGGDGRSTLHRAADESAQSFRKLGRTLLEYRPSIMDWWQVLALLIPILITLAGAAIGLAAAIGAVGTAAIALLGVGLLGWGEDVTSMMQNLRTTASDLAGELFGVFQPVGDTFQPIIQDWLGGAANEMQRLVQPLMGLTAFADGLEAMGAGFVDWIIEGIQAITALESEATQVAIVMGGAFGDFIIDALSAMLLEVHRNQQAYMEMAEMLLNIIVIIFNLSKVVTMVIAQFQPLFELAAKFTDLISNKWIVALLTLITAFTAFAGISAIVANAILSVAAAGGIMSAAMSTTMIPALIRGTQALIAYMTAANAAIASTLGLSTVLTGGLLGLGLLAGGGFVAHRALQSMSGPSGGGGGRNVGGTTVINISGDVREREVDRIVDEMGPVARNEQGISTRMSKNNG